MRLKVKRLKDIPLPSYATPGSSGLDLYAAEDVEILPGEFRLIGTGIAVEIPPGFEGEVRPRSGLAAKYGVTLLNTPGTIDADYRGEVKVVLINHGREIFHVRKGMRIAQLVIKKVERVEVCEVEELGETGRGEGGFGSTGL